MDKQRQDNQLEPIYNSSVPIWDIALKTSRKQWTIEMGSERGSGRSVLAAWHDDDDDDWYYLAWHDDDNDWYYLAWHDDDDDDWYYLAWHDDDDDNDWYYLAWQDDDDWYYLAILGTI